MNIKSLLLGGLISLIVTIVSGFAIYKITSKPEKGEILCYWFDKPTVFAKDSSTIAIQRIIITNKGNTASSNVNLLVKYPNDVIINDTSISSSLGQNFIFKQSIAKKNEYKLQENKLMPGESITVSYILKSDHYSFKPLIYLRSDDSVGKYIDLLAPVENTASTLLTTYLPIILIAQLILISLIILRRYVSSRTSINNTGFLFLHKNLPNYSKRIFERALLTKGGDSFIIGNYAVVKAVLGDFDDSNNLIQSALFYSIGSHEKAVCNFNHAIIYFLTGDRFNGRIKLMAAMKESPRSILKYVKFSDLIKKLREDAEINLIFKEVIK